MGKTDDGRELLPKKRKKQKEKKKMSTVIYLLNKCI